MLGLIAAAALAAQPASAPDLSWLAGYWLSCDGGREVSETWTDARGGQAFGLNVTLSGGRAGWEHMRIGPDAEGRLAFHAQPMGQPPASFPLAESGEERLVFEDPAHDFPQRVIYSRRGQTLVGRIEGVVDGRDRAAEWTFLPAPLNRRCPLVGGG